MNRDIEKVISELERWIGWMDEDAPVIALEALETLKEQRDTIKRLKDKLSLRKEWNMSEEYVASIILVLLGLLVGFTMGLYVGFLSKK